MFWEVASVVGKVLSLAGVAGVVGGMFSLYLSRHLGSSTREAVSNYLLASAVIGIAATVAFFCLQVGAINQSGIGGILDWPMAQILAQSSLGYSTGLRLLGFVMAAIAVLILRQHLTEVNSKHHRAFAYTLTILAFLALAASFTMTGHVTSLSWTAHIAIALHVFAVFLWIGSLWPLLHFCGLQGQYRTAVQGAMEEFGKFAIGLIAVLVSAGIFFLWQLLESWREIYTTDYGRGMLIKLSGVSVLLLLGATNKFRLVPNLRQPDGMLPLARSIRIEMGVVLLVLLITSYLTIIIGIES
ncbi:MAG: CopD family protein [Gammaproteobacteria bacterium]|nr:CopD family protein [Gammaproteobacteria bacterium]MBL4729754.1 CopD family protein [Gammaproteobacteria bacterium]MBL4891224.1 CopD family protein [Rhizobiaceae bacterium]